MDAPINSLVRFGVFELDPHAGELRRSGRRVALQPQPLEILRALVERPGEVVTREELRRRLWSNDAYVDFDRSLNKAIVKLRDALGDDADSPRYIETLPRHGYRFIPLPQVQDHVDAAPRTRRELTAGMPEPEGPTSRQHFSDSRVQSAGASHGWRWAALGLVLLALPAWLIGTRLRVGAPSHSGPPTNVAPAGAVAFAPPPHSVAVLPFVNLSGDLTQEYFSDGLTEELLNSLSRIDGLQVVGRTSSFYFKGKDVDLGTVGHRLNVAAVLEGSVRRSSQRVRVTARLTDAVTGFQLWSETYERDLGNSLRLQSEIANAVAATLKVTLLGNVAAKIELGGARNPAAFDAYLRASKAYWGRHDLRAAITGFSDAIRLDPAYALAYAARSIAFAASATFDLAPSMRHNIAEAGADAHKAVELAPELAESHLALAISYVQTSVDFARAEREYERALQLAPSSERMLRDYGFYAARMGHSDTAIAAARRAVALDPLAIDTYESLGGVLYLAGRNHEAILAYENSLALDPDDAASHGERGLAFYALGDFESARSSCEIKIENMIAQLCLSIAYDKLGRHSDAEAQVAKIRASAKDAGAYQYAEINAQWDKRAQALEWLAAAVRLRSPWLVWVKKDPLLDPLRNEPRFQAIERALRFPN